MQGYQWSIWYVPENWKSFMREHDMVHVPHLTIETNIPVQPTSFKNIIKLDKITFKSGIVKFKSQYRNDPLVANGWYCETPENWEYKHKPHVTWKYKCDVDHTVTNPTGMNKLFLAVADTRSGNPSKWTFNKISQW